jgi:hypothetical protein
MKSKLINFYEQTKKKSMDLLSLARKKLSTYAQKSDYKVYKAKPQTGLKATIAGVGNSTAIIGVFMGVAIAVNEPLRAELAKSLGSNIELANVNVENMDSAPTMKLVSMGKANVAIPKTGDLLLSPEVLRAPVPSIAPLAKQISGRIDPAAQDALLMSSVADQQKVANFMANKYRVDPKAINQYVSHAMVVAQEVDLDPVLLIAVMAIESNFNPNIQSNMGAQGLMQVLTRVHVDKFMPYGGPAAAFKPEANIRVGAYILKYFIAQAGSLQGGLRYYVGGAIAGDGGYAGKVMREREVLNALLKNTQIQEVPLDVSSAQFTKVLPPPTSAVVKPDDSKPEATLQTPITIEVAESKEKES